jgi:hypothetical protein
MSDNRSEAKLIEISRENIYFVFSQTGESAAQLGIKPGMKFEIERVERYAITYSYIIFTHVGKRIYMQVKHEQLDKVLQSQ